MLNFVVIENAGQDDERVVFECETVGQAHDYAAYHSPEEREELGIDVMRRKADGSLTTEL